MKESGCKKKINDFHFYTPGNMYTYASPQQRACSKGTSSSIVDYLYHYQGHTEYCNETEEIRLQI
jgi:hypothetical protein